MLSKASHSVSFPSAFQAFSAPGLPLRHALYVKLCSSLSSACSSFPLTFGPQRTLRDAFVGLRWTSKLREDGSSICSTKLPRHQCNQQSRLYDILGRNVLHQFMGGLLLSASSNLTLHGCHVVVALVEWDQSHRLIRCRKGAGSRGSVSSLVTQRSSQAMHPCPHQQHSL